MNELTVYTAEQVAKILQVAERTVYGYIKSGKLPASKVGKYWRVTEDQLKEFLNSCQTTKTR